MRRFVLYAIAILMPVLFGGCGDDAPESPKAETYSYQLTIQNSAPDCVTTTLTYIGAGDTDAITYLDGDDRPKEISSATFAVDKYRSVFKVEQRIADDPDVGSDPCVVGIKFTIAISSYDADGALIDTKEYNFDNLHIVEPSYLTTLFPRYYEYGIFDDGDKFSFRRVE